MDHELHENVYLVTGGSSGLGRATAEHLLDRGARVVVSGRDEKRLAEVDSDGRHADSLVRVVADNADADTPGRLIDAAIERWGRLDGALISVGGPPATSAADATDEQWEQAFATVFLGSVRLTRQIAERLGEGGSIALVLSSSVRSPIARLAISNGLRPGLAMFAKNLADEVGPRGVRVNGLLPGRIATDRVAELDAGTGDADAARAAAEASIPLRRYGDPEEFAAVASFLLSAASSYITGAMIPVDGGMSRSL